MSILDSARRREKAGEVRTPAATTPRARRGRGHRGAALVEYALGTALLLVAGLVAFNFLTDAADDQANAQADCISERPPPTSCVRTPVPAPSASTPPGSATTTTVSPTPTDPPPTTTTTAPPPESEVGAGTATTTGNPDGTWKVEAGATVTADPDAQPVEGAVVVARLVLGDQPVLTECTTAADGTCTLVVEPIPADVEGTTMTIVEVRSDPPSPGGPYPEWELEQP